MTKIEWTHVFGPATGVTWNPVTGCTKVSPGCKHCYAERLAGVRLKHLYPGGFGKVTMHPDRLVQPLHWRKPRGIFVCSMSDLFHEDVPQINRDGCIANIFAVMALCPQHRFMVLTKRINGVRGLLENMQFRDSVANYIWKIIKKRKGTDDSVLDLTPVDWPEHLGANLDWPLPNVWLGVSVENPNYYDRIHVIQQIPAVVRFVSLEPLLADVPNLPLDGIHWIITGGESGPGARPSHPDWFRSVRDQCQAAGVPYFFKQWGEWAPTPGKSQYLDGYGVLDMARVGKKAAGRLLDGVEYSEFPHVG